MKFEKLLILLPCQTLEGYTLDRQTEHADELLSAWSAMYHPALLAGAKALPHWASASEPPKDPAGSLVMLPPASEKVLAAEWVDQAIQSGACLIRGLRDREPMVDAALERLDGGPVEVAPDLAADFLALGFCHMQIEVLTRDAGYDMGSDIHYYDEQYYDYGGQFDRGLFEQDTVAAAVAACQGEEQTAREQLRAALTRLTDARRGLPYTYSADVDPHLLDITLVASTTLGASLREELARQVPTHLLVSGEVIERMAREEPATLAALIQALENSTATVIGGGFREAALPLLAPEAILDDFRRGFDAYRRHLGQRPTIFARRRFGLSPVLPQVLRRFGFDGAVHFTLDDGRFPTSSQSKIWWVGVDGTELEALAQVPADAGRASTFLNLAGKVSNASYHEHNATAVLAHWPGQVSPWYRDVQRVAAYSPVLGEFRTISEYLEQSQSISQWTRSGPDDYRSPYLRQAVSRRQPDPISRWVRHHRRRAVADSVQTLSAMADLLGGSERQTLDMRDLYSAIDDAEGSESDLQANLDERLGRGLEEATGRFVGSLPREESGGETGHLIANPWSFPRRALVDVTGLGQLPAPGGPVRAAGESAGRKQVVAEVPAMGFCWIGAGSGDAAMPEKAHRRRRRTKGRETPMAEGNVLRNELFEVTINPTTGAIQTIHDYATRGNRLAQQIALRLPRARDSRQAGWGENDLEEDYSVMVADQVAVTSSGPVAGEIVCRGRLLNREGKRLARFVQTTQAWRASPILSLNIDLEVDEQPGANPWDSYYAARFAWEDAAADVFRSVSLASRATERNQLEAPHFVEIRSGARRFTILTGGLPYHRRFGLRKLDTLLVVRGETSRSFRLGIGVNLTHPVPAALDFLAPAQVPAERTAPPRGRSGWLFHVDARNVVATRWEPLRSDGQLIGFRVRLLETEGRRCEVGLRSFRPVQSARKVDFQNEHPTEVPVQGDKIAVDLGAHEWAQVEAEFG